jgi:hypothetical protein
MAEIDNFCSRFGIKPPPDGDLIKVRAEKKCQAIIEYLGLAPTPEDLKTGKIFQVERGQYTIIAAFISTKQGGLIGAATIIETACQQYGFTSSSSLDGWVWRKVYDHHKTAEDVEREEDFKRRREERLIKSAEWEKKNTELRRTEYLELKEQVKHSSLPDARVDALVALAVKETDEQREAIPDRRPTFAPPIPFSEALIALLERHKALDSKTQFEPGYGRLWAVWESPKKAHGKCKGFELRAGKAHDGLLITNVRSGSGAKWWTGPEWTIPHLHLREWMKEVQVAIQEKTYRAEKERFILHCELRESGTVEILKFAGAPEKIMLAGARLAKICCRCGRALTDPTSMALGIGPECLKEATWWAQYLDGWTKEQTLAYYLAREESSNQATSRALSWAGPPRL